MTYSISKKLLTATSALLLLSMKSISASAGDVNPISPLRAEYGLREAAEQYLLHYPSRSGVDGKTVREDTAAVFIPFGVTPKRGWPVVVWAHGTVGVASHCAPSLNPRSDRDKQYLNTWLSLGYAVVAPDYAGLGSSGLHHYLNSRGEAWSILDGIRAALKHFPLKNELILVGQSQGAHAAFASAGYQHEYAPELNIRATVLTGSPYFEQGTTATDILPLGRDTPTSGDPKIPYIFYIYLSAADSNLQLNPTDYFQDKALPLLKEANKLCIVHLNDKVMKAGLNSANSLKPGVESLLNTSVGTMIYPTLKINHPVFFGIGSVDINVPTAMQKRFSDAVKNAGTQVDVHIYEGLDHSGTVNPSLRDSVPFLSNVFHNN
ncbi:MULTISPECIES: alpha/beta hydrolase [Enterobacteriaceae]|uniref:alpha/beta hydrolase n=1 Tax=Enterobacteriaceae TaxID=543 RepID=UPI000B8E337D|nr:MULTISPECIES: alpha/beta hydrolase [Enterobacteriaceae]EMB9958158.1 alpha/beta hydrolase [Escherichia coli]MBA8128380.1 alpha/beta hydrolase [Citrobacter sp. RHBSTW-00013]MCX3172374.1 alpha/beta hydrolase [Escherichia coli]MYL95721.1 alpha/beta hydrolase [Citrobacter werkmanii]QLZ42952.1 alpha/beta hydrolase [Citrobacter sp. RHBSTW-00127]